jgi:hypothetical protein
VLKMSFEKKSLQKVLEKFGGYEKRFYLCNRFPLQMRSGFSNGSLIYWLF